MPHSLRAKLSGLRYKGILEDKDYKRLCTALDNEIEIRDLKLQVASWEQIIDDIRAEILNWEDEPECDDDPYQIGAKDMQKYVLAIIDKHIKAVEE